jgi:hypothetical protein
MSANLTSLTKSLGPRREKQKRERNPKPKWDAHPKRPQGRPKPVDDPEDSDESFQASEALFVARRSA